MTTTWNADLSNLTAAKMTTIDNEGVIKNLRAEVVTLKAALAQTPPPAPTELGADPAEMSAALAVEKEAGKVELLKTQLASSQARITHLQETIWDCRGQIKSPNADIATANANATAMKRGRTISGDAGGATKKPKTNPAVETEAASAAAASGLH